MRQRNQENGLLGDSSPDGAGAVGPDSDGLNAALARCADGDRQGIDDLRAWEDGRLRAMLVRMLGDTALADAVLAAALDDVFRNAGMLVAVGQGPSDDRVFALVRRHAYAALRTREHRAAAPPPVPLRPPPAAPPSASIAPAPAAPTPPPASGPDVVTRAPAAELPPPLPGDPAPAAPMALGVATRAAEAPRLRRPGLRDSVEDDGPGDEDEEPFDEGEPRRRRWLLAAFAWLAAALVGFGIAVVVAGWLMIEAPAPPAPPASPPVTSLAPPPAAEPAAPPLPSAGDPGTGEPPARDAPPPSRDLLGDPLEALEPAPLLTSPLRVMPAPVAAPRPAAPPPAPAPSAPAPEPPAAAPPSPAQPPPAREQAVLPPAAAPPRPATPPAAPPPVEVLATPDRGLSAASVLPDSARLFIHHSVGDSAAAARARALAQRLQQRGAAVVIVRPVPFGIRGLSVRFFHQADRPAATAVLGDVASSGGSRSGPARPSDFTAFQPAPRPGTVEIWLPGGA